MIIEPNMGRVIFESASKETNGYAAPVPIGHPHIKNILRHKPSSAVFLTAVHERISAYSAQSVRWFLPKKFVDIHKHYSVIL